MLTVVVYAVMRGGQLVALYQTAEAAEQRAQWVNDTFSRGKRTTVIPMTVLEDPTIY